VVFVADVAAIITAAAALAALIGGYIQFVLRRAIHPCIEFEVEFSSLNCPSSDQEVGEITCWIRNEGPGVGYVTKVRCRARYRLVGESGETEDEPDFTHRLPDKGFFYLDPMERFIQPGVTQRYRKPLAFPADTCLIHVWGQFEYKLAVGWATIFIANILRQPRGPNPTEYRVRRTFAVGNDRDRPLT
jgi:hypothetical protein